MSILFKGSGVAIVTPFNKDCTVNFPKLRELIEFQITNETDAIIICGTTGEASVLSAEQQIECVRFTAEVVNKRIPVIAGTGSNVTQHAIELSQSAEEAGADGVLVVTPYYNKCTQKGLVAHYKAIADSINIPIILYNVPSRTGMSISPKTCLELSKIKNIVGIKDATGDISKIAEIASTCVNDNFALYSGNDDQTLPMLSLGGLGVISVLANIAPKNVHNMVKNYLDGNVNESRKLFLDALDIANTIFIEVNPIPVKKALNIMGYEVGACTMPLSEIEEDHLEVLKTSMKNYGLI